MSKVRIVTDSTADIPEELLDKYEIKVVPLKVIFSDTVYKDWEELKPKEFYKKLKESSYLPTTSQPTPVEFAEVYQELLAKDESVISLHLSSDLSGTYQSANLGKQMVNGGDIEVIDTKMATLVLGVLVIEAAKAAQAGKSKEEILQLIKTMQAKLELYFIVEDLQYLQKGGRIGKASAVIGSILNIKPVLKLIEGIVTPIAKVRGTAKAFEKIIEEIKAKVPAEQPMVFVFVHCDNLEAIEQLKAKIEVNFKIKESYTSEVGAVIGTHVGPGTIGIGYYPFEGE